MLTRLLIHGLHLSSGLGGHPGAPGGTQIAHTQDRPAAGPGPHAFDRIAPFARHPFDESRSRKLLQSIADSPAVAEASAQTSADIAAQNAARNAASPAIDRSIAQLERDREAGSKRIDAAAPAIDKDKAQLNKDYADLAAQGVVVPGPAIARDQAQLDRDLAARDKVVAEVSKQLADDTTQVNSDIARSSGEIQAFAPVISQDINATNIALGGGIPPVDGPTAQLALNATAPAAHSSSPPAAVAPDGNIPAAVPAPAPAAAPAPASGSVGRTLAPASAAAGFAAAVAALVHAL